MPIKKKPKKNKFPLKVYGMRSSYGSVYFQPNLKQVQPPVGKSCTVGVYKLIGTIEVSNELKKSEMKPLK